MIQCQNCGQVNNYGSNFCRFCGTKFLVNQISNANSFEQLSPPPRPYSWKTDEFQINEPLLQKPKTRQINQVQPLDNRNRLNNQNPFATQPPPPPQPLAYQKPQQNMAYNLHCPRCASQIFKTERKVSTMGWIVFAVLLVTFFPLFWIGLLIKEDVRVCQACNFRIEK